MRGIWPLSTKPMPQVLRRDDNGFDPERVPRYNGIVALSCGEVDPDGPLVDVRDYAALLVLYRELKAKEAFHGF